VRAPIAGIHIPLAPDCPRSGVYAANALGYNIPDDEIAHH